MIKRTLETKLLSYFKQYPVITLTGPRQSGKTTLCKKAFPQLSYFSLEDMETRNYAKTDPRSFLQECVKKGAIIDEIQRLPELTSYIQTIVDEKNKEGLFVITGSQNFQLLSNVSQSLAGRTALATLLPFAYAELYRNKPAPALDAMLYSGFYPRIYDKKLNPTEALSFYVSTYLERDIRALLNIKDLSAFENFLKLCAGRSGQILNVSNLANDCGINHNTAKNWLSLLEASYVIFLLRPYHKNFNKRLVKSPKLYFTDTGLAAYLLEIKDAAHLTHHPLKGQLFETFVVTEILKSRFNSGKTSNLYYFRDNIGNEVDLILENGADTMPIEIKMGKTVNEDFFKGIKYHNKINPQATIKSYVVYGGEQNQLRDKCEVVSYKNIPLF